MAAHPAEVAGATPRLPNPPALRDPAGTRRRQRCCVTVSPHPHSASPPGEGGDGAHCSAGPVGLLLRSPAARGGTRCCQLRAPQFPWTHVQQRWDGRGVYCRAGAEQRASWESYSDLSSHLIFPQHNFLFRLQLSGASHLQRRGWTRLPALRGRGVPMPGPSICPW